MRSGKIGGLILKSVAHESKPGYQVGLAEHRKFIDVLISEILGLG